MRARAHGCGRLHIKELRERHFLRRRRAELYRGRSTGAHRQSCEEHENADQGQISGSRHPPKPFALTNATDYTL